MEVVLYSTHCPRCNVLTKKLESKNISFQEVNDVTVMEEKGIDAVPVLEVDGVMMSFTEANKWLNEKE